MRGDPPPRGGERRDPNPLFVAHAAAITELYVLLTTHPPEGMRLSQFERDAQAREEFKDAKGRVRSITPDATICLTSTRKRWNHVAFVEIDRGTMSHAQLRGKADRYAAYVASEAWRIASRTCPRCCSSPPPMLVGSASLPRSRPALTATNALGVRTRSALPPVESSSTCRRSPQSGA